MIGVLYDDRPAALTGLKLAALSLRQHHPRLPLWIIAPQAPDSFKVWSQRIPGLTVEREPIGLRGRGWNVKPAALAAALDMGHEEALWVDSDIVVTGDLLARLRRMTPGSLVATEEYYWGHGQGGTARTRGLGLKVARTFQCTLNTAIVRVTPDHRRLLNAWSEVLRSKAYLEAQGLPAARRPIEYFGDQEVLTGLLGATDFAYIPVDTLRRGRDIAQCFGPSGFTPLERIRCGRTLPIAVHAMGQKPWSKGPSGASSGLKQRILGYYERVHLELTPYVAAARPYRQELEEDAAWMDPETLLGRLLHGLVTVPTYEELPLSVLDSLQRRFRRLAGIRQLHS